VQTTVLDNAGPDVKSGPPSTFTAAAVKRPDHGVSPWLVGPAFDLLFIANAVWPLLVLLQFAEGFGGRPAVQFWQIYYITTPHRWITLLIVFLDRDRLRQGAPLFLLTAAGVVAFCLTVRLTTGALTCLLAIDYFWNAWHFAAQHHGVYRIYGRLAGQCAPPTSEKWAMRLFLLYVILRVATATWSEEVWRHGLARWDWAAAAVPIWLLVRDGFRFGATAPGRVAYLVSVSALYLSLLWAVHERRAGLCCAWRRPRRCFTRLSTSPWSPGRCGSGMGATQPGWACWAP
jgi:hypothetical protein